MIGWRAFWPSLASSGWRRRGRALGGVVGAALALGVAAPTMAEEAAEAPEALPSQTEEARLFTRGVMQTVGRSAENMSRFRAARSAAAATRQGMLERLRGVAVHGDLLLGDLMGESEWVRTRVQGFVAQAESCGRRYLPGPGVAERCLRVHLAGRGGVYDVLLPTLRKAGMIPVGPPPEWEGRGLGEEVFAPPTIEEESPQFDGLIVTLEGMPFRPALVNRLLGEGGEVLLEPGVMEESLIRDRGCGATAHHLEEAQAMLTAWGAAQPAVARALDLYKQTDPVLGAGDVELVRAADRRNGFLAQGRVVYLLP
ncbi:MAG: hypothetical protein HQL51_06480 [Magnetococcales bacterium]|nr:hypothetical protein [Magnetococcales bacterium]